MNPHGVDQLYTHVGNDGTVRRETRMGCGGAAEGADEGEGEAIISLSSPRIRFPFLRQSLGFGEVVWIHSGCEQIAHVRGG